MFAETEDGNKIYIPKYVAKAFKRYRYNKNDKVLQKQCAFCLEWFNVLRLVDGKWLDVHDEDKIHLAKGISGFSVGCVACNSKKEIDKNAIIKETEKNEKFSLYLKPTNKKYLEDASKLNGINIADLLNQLIEKEQEKRPIKVLAKKLYENLMNK
jgi:hypothetical protein